MLFTPERCGRLIGAIRAGQSVEDACEAAGVSRATYQGWMRKGARADGGAYRQFRADVEAARVRREFDALTDADLVRMLEQKAREGSIKAMELLLRRPWERSRDDGDSKPKGDPFAEVDELAERRARAA